MTPQNALIDLVETTKTAVLTYAQEPAVQEALEAPLEGWTPSVSVLASRVEEFRVLTFGMGFTLSQVPGTASRYGAVLVGMATVLNAVLETEKDPIRSLRLLKMWLGQTLHELSPQWYAHLVAGTSLTAKQGETLEHTLSPNELTTFKAVCQWRNRVFDVLHSREWDSDEVMQSWVEELPFERPNGLKA